MAKFRKKPVVIEALQFDGSPASAIHIKDALGVQNSGLVDGGYRIATLEGEMLASPGDWVIKGVKGEIYPCKPDIFAATYEPVEEPKPATCETFRIDPPNQ